MVSSKVIRDPNWQILLSHYMNAATDRVGEWGKFDCALNCADAVLAFTHIDFAAQFRGHYSDEEGAKAILHEYGFENTLHYISSLFPSVSEWGKGFSGDLGAFRYGDEDIVGVIYKNRIFSPSPGTRGMGSVNLSKAHTIFKVGTP